MSTKGDLSVALKEDGTVVCWGAGSYALVPPAEAVNIVKIAAGFAHIVALKRDSTVISWGYGPYGQTAVPADLLKVTDIGAGHMHSLALQSNGTVRAWGDDASNQVSVPQGLKDVASISAGTTHSVVLKKDGTIAWGNKYSLPKGFEHITSIAVGVQWVLGLRSDSTVVAWGVPAYAGQKYTQLDVPEGLIGVVAVAGGVNYSLALKKNGDAIGWGIDAYGETAPYNGRKLKSILASNGFNLGLTENGEVKGWGRNEEGQLNIPVGLTGVKQIQVSSYIGMALKNDGTIVGWGSDNNKLNIPAGITDVEKISVGYYPYAIKKDGIAWTWYDGQATYYDFSPAKVKEIASGQFYNLFLNDDDTLRVWNNTQENVYSSHYEPDMVQVCASFFNLVGLRKEKGVITAVNTLIDGREEKELLYPNPCREVLNFSYKNKPESIKVISLTGQVQQIISEETGNVISIKTHDLPKGMYFLLLEEKGRKSSHLFNVH